MGSAESLPRADRERFRLFSRADRVLMNRPISEEDDVKGENTDPSRTEGSAPIRTKPEIARVAVPFFYHYIDHLVL
jgi:hypothetical protein